MPRPPLPIGTAGNIRTVKRGTAWVAVARFRDFDGVTRLVERSSAKSREAAQRALKTALTQRGLPAEDELTGETTMLVAGAKWFADEIEGHRATATVTRYAYSLLDVNQGLGGVRLREMTTARCDTFLRAMLAKRGPATTKLAKTVLSGILGMAARMGAIAANPVRDVGTIRTTSEEVRALSVEEMRELREILAGDRKTVLADVPGPVDFMLGTGARIGEVFALRWADVHLAAAKPYVDIVATTVFVSGRGATVENHTKTSSSRRRLWLPQFVVDMLDARQADSTCEWVFPSVDDTVRDANNFRKQLRRATAGTAFDWVKPHTFRKSVATLLDDLEDASKQLGHSGTGVTEKHYVKRTHEGPDVRSRLQLVAG